MIDLKHAIAAGHAARATAHAVAEQPKLGHFRGGSTGIVTEDGTVYGKCPRLAFLRSIGIDLPVTQDRQKMFMAGESSERDFLEVLRASGADVRVGEEIARSYTLDDGTVVSCRPDGVVYVNSQPVLGLELKCASSIWTALGVNFDLKPKSDHLIQAAHYSVVFGGLPFALVYSSGVDWHVSTAPKFITAKFGTGGVAGVEYKEGKPFKVLPFDRVYTLRWSGPPGAGGALTYHTEGLDAPVTTAITAKSIQAFHHTVAALRDGGALPPRPSAKSVDGTKSYKACDYCDLKSVCDNHEADRATWLDHVRLGTGGPCSDTIIKGV